MTKCLVCILGSFLLASCGAVTSKNPDHGSFHFNSNDWLLERYKQTPSNPLNIEINVTQTGQSRYFIKMDFQGDSQDPIRGINPTSVSLLSFCVNNYVAQKGGKPAWVAGGRETDFTPRKRYYSLIIGGYSALTTIEKDGESRWFHPVRTSSLLDKCRNLVKSEYVE